MLSNRSEIMKVYLVQAPENGLGENVEGQRLGETQGHGAGTED